MKAPFQFNPKRSIIEVTYNCNLRCKTCAVWTSAFKSLRSRNKRYLTLKQLESTQGSLARSGIKRITYLGGEPFIRKDLLKLAAHARSLGLSTAVVTNGTLISRRIAEEIIKKNLFEIIIFSIDGPEDVHDNIRGVPGTFKKATEAIKNLQKLKKSKKLKYPKVFIYVTVSRLNYGYIDSVLKIARQLDAHTIRFISASCLDSTIINKTNALFKSPVIPMHSYAVGQDLKIPKDKLAMLAKQWSRAQEYAKNIGLRLQVEEYLRNAKGAGACGFLGRDFVISPYGQVYPCPMLPGYTIGNIPSIPLHRIMENKPAIKKVKRILELSLCGELPVCRQCCVEKIYQYG